MLKSTAMRRRCEYAAVAILLLPALLDASARATGDAELDRVMQQLAQRQHGHATFVEQTYSSLLKAPVQSSGELWFDASGRLEKKVLAPQPEDFKLDGDQLQLIRGGRQRSASLQQFPQFAPLFDGLRQTLVGDLPALQRSFDLSFAEQSGGWTLTLRPLQPQLARWIDFIRISGQDGSLREVLTQRRNGDHSIMKLTPVD
ncbi:MAG TPA: LolA-related protein [Steroidobacteraceae bacterium]